MTERSLPPTETEDVRRRRATPSGIFRSGWAARRFDLRVWRLGDGVSVSTRTRPVSPEINQTNSLQPSFLCAFSCLLWSAAYFSPTLAFGVTAVTPACYAVAVSIQQNGTPAVSKGFLSWLPVQQLTPAVTGFSKLPPRDNRLFWAQTPPPPLRAVSFSPVKGKLQFIPPSHPTDWLAWLECFTSGGGGGGAPNAGSGQWGSLPRQVTLEKMR